MKKNSKLINNDNKMSYQKVPKYGASGVACIIAFILLMGLFVYSAYFKDKKVLTCKKNSNILIEENNIPYEATIELTFKKNIYENGSVKQIFDLSNYSSDTIDIVNKQELCNSVLMPNESNNKYSYDDCKQELDGKNLIVKANYIIESDKDIKLNDEKSKFEKIGYTCQ